MLNVVPHAAFKGGKNRVVRRGREVVVEESVAAHPLPPPSQRSLTRQPSQPKP